MNRSLKTLVATALIGISTLLVSSKSHAGACEVKPWYEKMPDVRPSMVRGHVSCFVAWDGVNQTCAFSPDSPSVPQMLAPSMPAGSGPVANAKFETLVLESTANLRASCSTIVAEGALLTGHYFETVIDGVIYSSFEVNPISGGAE